LTNMAAGGLVIAAAVLLFGSWVSEKFFNEPPISRSVFDRAMAALVAYVVVDHLHAIRAHLAELSRSSITRT